MPGRKGEKGLLLVGHEKVPHGSGLTGDRSSDRADGARAEGLPEPRTSTSFLRYGTLDWEKGRRKDCEFVGILKDFSILMKTLSHYSKPV